MTTTSDISYRHMTTEMHATDAFYTLEQVRISLYISGNIIKSLLALINVILMHISDMKGGLSRKIDVNL